MPTRYVHSSTANSAGGTGVNPWDPGNPTDPDRPYSSLNEAEANLPTILAGETWDVLCSGDGTKEDNTSVTFNLDIPATATLNIESDQDFSTSTIPDHTKYIRGRSSSVRSITVIHTGGGTIHFERLVNYFNTAFTNDRGFFSPQSSDPSARIEVCCCICYADADVSLTGSKWSFFNVNGLVAGEAKLFVTNCIMGADYGTEPTSSQGAFMWATTGGTRDDFQLNSYNCTTRRCRNVYRGAKYYVVNCVNYRYQTLDDVASGTLYVTCLNSSADITTVYEDPLNLDYLLQSGYDSTLIDDATTNATDSEVPLHDIAGTTRPVGDPLLGVAATVAGAVVPIGDPVGLVTGAPTLGTPAGSAASTGAPVGLVTGSPTLGAPVGEAASAGAAVGLVTGAPTLGTPDGASVVIGDAVGIVTGAPELGTPASVEDLLPVITRQPEASPLVIDGTNAVLYMAATSFTAQAFQWQSNSGTWTDIVGETSPLISLASVGLVDDGSQYRCQVTNAAGTVTTDVATLRVVPALPANYGATHFDRPTNSRLDYVLPASVPVGAFSVFFYANVESANTPDQYFLTSTDAAGTDLLDIFQLSDSQKLRLSVEHTGGNLVRRSSGALFSNNTTHTVLVTWDGTTAATGLNAWVDGTPVTFNAVEDTNGSGTHEVSNKFHVGDRPDGLRSLGGWMAHVARWDRVLTAQEISDLGTGVKLPDEIDGKVFYAPLMGGDYEEKETSTTPTASGTVTATTALPYQPTNQLTIVDSGDRDTVASWVTGNSSIDVTMRQQQRFDQTTDLAWFGFQTRIENWPTSQPFRVRLFDDGGNAMYDNKRFTTDVAFVFSQDKQTWRELPKSTQASSAFGQFWQLVISPEGLDPSLPVYLGLQHPYTVADTVRWLDDHKDSAFVTPVESAGADFVRNVAPSALDELGGTITASNQYGFKIVDPAFAGTLPKVAIFSGQHGFEDGASQQMLEVASILLGNIEAMRTFEWRFYPDINVQGRKGGNVRYAFEVGSGNNRDPNREWGTAELDVVTELIADFRADHGGGWPDIALDLHTNQNSDGNRELWHDTATDGPGIPQFMANIISFDNGITTNDWPTSANSSRDYLRPDVELSLVTEMEADQDHDDRVTMARAIVLGVTLTGAPTGDPDGLVTGAPTLGTPSGTASSSGAPDGLVTGVPTIGVPSGSSVVIGDPVGLATGAPTLGTPAGNSAASGTPVGLVTGPPTLGVPVGAAAPIGDAVGLVTGAPTLGSPTGNASSSGTPVGIVTGDPTIGVPSGSSVSSGVAVGLATGAPTIGVPVGSTTPVGIAIGLVTGAPSLGSPAGSASSVGSPMGIVTGSPTLGTPRDINGPGVDPYPVEWSRVCLRGQGLSLRLLGGVR